MASLPLCEKRRPWERFARLWLSAWHFIVAADDRCRAAHIERIRRKKPPPTTANRVTPGGGLCSSGFQRSHTGTGRQGRRSAHDRTAGRDVSQRQGKRKHREAMKQRWTAASRELSQVGGDKGSSVERGGGCSSAANGGQRAHRPSTQKPAGTERSASAGTTSNARAARRLRPTCRAEFTCARNQHRSSDCPQWDLGWVPY